MLLATAHGTLWHGSASYRAAWWVWPQAVVALLCAFLWTAWFPPAVSPAHRAALTPLYERAKTDKAALDQLESIARKGDAVAYGMTGFLYDPKRKAGKAAPYDLPRALRYYQLGAEGGDPAAQRSLAQAYDTGRDGFARNLQHALRWYAVAGAAGDDIALANLGQIYQVGDGVPPDYAKARSLFEQGHAAKGGRSTARLGFLYFNGLGVPVDMKRAAELYQQSVDLNDGFGMYGLALMTHEGLGGQTKDPVRAGELVVKSLQQKFADTPDFIRKEPISWVPAFWQSISQKMQLAGDYTGPVVSEATPDLLASMKRLAAPG